MIVMSVLLRSCAAARGGSSLPLILSVLVVVVVTTIVHHLHHFRPPALIEDDDKHGANDSEYDVQNRRVVEGNGFGQNTDVTPMRDQTGDAENEFDRQRLSLIHI